MPGQGPSHGYSSIFGAVDTLLLSLLLRLPGRLDGPGRIEDALAARLVGPLGAEAAAGGDAGDRSLDAAARLGSFGAGGLDDFEFQPGAAVEDVVGRGRLPCASTVRTRPFEPGILGPGDSVATDRFVDKITGRSPDGTDCMSGQFQLPEPLVGPGGAGATAA